MQRPSCFGKNIISFSLLSILVSGCYLDPKPIPFPESENAFVPVKTDTLKLSPPKPFKWIEIPVDKSAKRITTKFDLDKILSISFSINDFEPLDKPAKEINFNINNLPDSMVDFSKLPEKAFTLQTYILPRPEIIRVQALKLKEDLRNGILQLNEDLGLPGKEINEMMVDRLGFIWIATGNKLCRLNGESLEVYALKVGKENNLSSELLGSQIKVNGLLEDKLGQIWALTNTDGIYILNLKTGLLKKHETNIFGFEMIEDHDGKIWAASLSDGLFIIDPVHNTIKNFRPNPGQKDETNIISLIEDKDSRIWLLTRNGILVINKLRNGIKKINTTLLAEGRMPGEIYNDRTGRIWISYFSPQTETGLIQAISIDKGNVLEWDQFPGKMHTIFNITQDQGGDIWLIANDTSYVLKPELNRVKKILTKSIQLANNKGRVIISPEGQVWIGTLNSGILIVDPKGPQPQHFGKDAGLRDNHIWGLKEDSRKNIWISTNNGLHIFNPNTKTLKIIGNKEGLTNDNITKAIEDSNGRIWVSGSGLNLIDLTKKEISKITKKNGLLSNDLLGIAEDSMKRIWCFSRDSGIYVYSDKDRSMLHLDKSRGLLSNTIWTIEKDQRGYMWLGSDSGIMVIDPFKNTIQYIKPSHGIVADYTSKILQDHAGNLWLATPLGISVIDPQNDFVTNITEREGLNPEIIYDLIESNGIVYAGSSNGMFQINTINGDKDHRGRITGIQILQFNKNSGFLFNDFNANTGMATSSGQLWWGIQEVMTVVTHLPALDTVKPFAYIQSVNILDKHQNFLEVNDQLLTSGKSDTIWIPGKKKYFTSKKEYEDSVLRPQKGISWEGATLPYNIPVNLVLSHDNNYINFRFTSPQFKHSEQIKYRFILEGIDKSWSELVEKPFSENYRDLSPGKYSFKVRSKSFNGRWSDPAEIKFTILRPWWLSWWASVTYFLLVVTIIRSYTGYRSRRLHLENIALEEKIHQRTLELKKSLEDLKSTQSQLIQSEKMASLGELTAGIAHEIQNPLNFVNNFSEVNTELLTELKDGPIRKLSPVDKTEAEEIIENLLQNQEKINFHGNRADSIVKSMLQHSRKSTDQKESIDINALADEYLRLSYHGIRAKDKVFNASLHTDFDTTIGEISVIPQEMGRVLLNLYNNAFYAVTEKKKKSGTEYEPTVTVSTRKIKDKIEIEVKDNGMGIPKQMLDKIYQPFFTTKPSGEGTGLGLSLSFDIITKGHGGTMNVDTKEGEYTRFIIHLPITSTY